MFLCAPQVGYASLPQHYLIWCFTQGFDVSFHLDFDIVGRGGVTLKEHHTPEPKTYLSIVVDGFPNLFQSFGPNSGLASGNLLFLVERQVDYAVAATLKLQRERLKSIEVKKEAVEDFEEYLTVRSPPLSPFDNDRWCWFCRQQNYFPMVGIWHVASS